MGMGGSVLTKGQAKQAGISAVITRADGSVEDLGVLSYWHRNPFKHYPVNAWIKFKEWRRLRANKAKGITP